ncbi:MAG: K(+)-stimulated pyrophosphate-energized sodium pump [Chloroflexota bacterium]|nr:K(+)-stimulated pyrophosphate-energized sodium pump [Chloroflexota bacterium]HEV7604507.1 sodium-translocating pyrophosphatase [Candidatus Limnocylindrales bacterium]
MDASSLQLIILPAGIIAILFAIYLARDVLARDTGTQAMQDVAGTIYEGAVAFIRRQYVTIGVLAVVGAVAVGIIISVFETQAVADTAVFGTDLGIRTGFAFLVGAACSMASGIIGMFISVKANVRTASAARRSLVEAVQVAMRGGAVSGFLVVALSLLGVYGIFALFGGLNTDTVRQAPFLIVGYGFGASFVALFAQLGGGIYTKAADVGSDLVGKVEAGIPEDDPRNAGVIADLVGDNVGDCAGRGADLFESTAAENIGAMILGVGVYVIAQAAGWPHPEAWIFFPLVVRAFGLLATIVAIFFVRGSETENPMNMLNRGYWVTTLLSVIGLGITTAVMMNTNGATGSVGALPTWVYFFAAGVVGLATSVAFVYITQFYTAGTYRPVREIAEASRTGPATNIIAGTAVGYETTFVTAITIGIALFASHWLGEQAGLVSGGRNVGGIFGTAVATMGMLMTTAYILAMDTFGPITDNAGGIAEFSRAEAGAREITDRLDAVGNTTKALTKGYAIASASLAAFLLFSAYIDKINLILTRQGKPLMESVNLANVNVFIAALIAAMLVYFFSSLAIRAVGNTAQAIIVEVRRQFREMPGIMDYSQRPDYARVVDITTKAALREMIAPGLVAVATPIVVGVLLGYEAVAGMLMVGTISGVMLATVLNNSGGAWDNAKKYIESGHLLDAAGNVLGKKTDAHAAAVVGDTVGDPFKDTAGPSLHVLIKLLATVTLVMAPLFIR